MSIIAPNAAEIPASLKDRPDWVAWRLELRDKNDEKLAKIPYQANGRRASSTDPTTWTDFSTAWSTFELGSYHGIGIALRPNLVGVDLDKCRDPETGIIEPWALGVVRALNSYTEVSPSGTGIRIFCYGSLPAKGRRRGRIEMYSEGRYLTTTGAHVDGSPLTVEDRTTELAEVHGEFIWTTPEEDTAPGQPQVVRKPVALDDQDLLEKAFASKGGDRIRDLMAGAWEAHGPTPSEATLSLLNSLAFWTNGDAVRVDRIFRSSGMMRPKFDDKRGDTTHGALDIAKAIAGLKGGGYDPNYKSEPRVSAEPKEDEEDVVPITGVGYPDPPRSEVFHGVAGAFVRAIEPHTEADNMALLSQLLVAFGNVVGRQAFFQIEDDRHYMNENLVIVGNTSGGRKGTSWGRVRKRVRELDIEWGSKRIEEGGLSSGEGLIWAVRDPIFEFKKAKKDLPAESVQVDPGIHDKRLLVTESEFARALQNMTREGNTLSSVIRAAWDTGSISSLTKNSPARATGAHISLIGHITKVELSALFAKTEAVNGFGNRFLWICAKRSKRLPFGGKPDPEKLKEIDEFLGLALRDAHRTYTMERSEEANQLWDEVYGELSEPRGGLLGSMLARGSSHVMRLACIYALLDSTIGIVDAVHLRAALAFWDYAERSAKFIFGEAMDDPVAVEILKALKTAPAGLTRNEISVDVFRRNKKSLEIRRALNYLLSSGFAKPESRVRTVGAVTRPVEIWIAMTH